MAMISWNSAYNEYCCGIAEIGNFHQRVSGLAMQYSEDGVAFYTAAFINTSECKQAYTELKNKLTLIYQSPVKVNPSSGNQLFMCVYIPKKGSK